MGVIFDRTTTVWLRLERWGFVHWRILRATAACLKLIVGDGAVRAISLGGTRRATAIRK